MKLSILILVLILSSCSSKPLEFKTVKKGKLYYTGYGDSEYRKRVIIVDTGISPINLRNKSLCRDVAEVSIHKNEKTALDHGNTMYSIASDNMDTDKFCITSFKYPNKLQYSYFRYAHHTILSLKNVKYVNMSYRVVNYDHLIYKAIKLGIESGITYITASGNDRMNLGDLCIAYPSCYAVLLQREPDANLYRSKFKIIAAIGDYTNYGSVVDLYLEGKYSKITNMQGSSISAALYTNMMIRKQDP